MADYGVTPTGFEIKRLPAILDDIEEENRATFGAGVIQSAASPIGQLNGLHADISALIWELAESVYQANDPDQAEGVNLDRLGKLRLLARASGESDIDFRQAITNTGRARIDMSDLSQAVSALPGVTYVQAFVNADSTTDANGIPPNTVAVAVLGGDDEEVARVVRAYVVPGVGTYGNTTVSVTIEGFCRTIKIVRPTEVPIRVEVDVVARSDQNGCPPPSALAIASGLVESLSGASRPRNGDDVTAYLIRQAIESRYPNIEVTDVDVSVFPASVTDPPVTISFVQIATFAVEHVTVNPT